MTTDELLNTMVSAMVDETSRMVVNDEFVHCNAFISSARIVFEFLAENATIVKVSDVLYKLGLNNQVIGFGTLYLSADSHELAHAIIC